MNPDIGRVADYQVRGKIKTLTVSGYSQVISEAGLQRLRELMPEAKDSIKPGLRPVQILGLFTVQTFVRTVAAKREGRTI